MKHQYNQVGFDPWDYTFVHPIDRDEHLSYVRRVKELIGSSDKRYTTITLRDTPEIECVFCRTKQAYKIYNHMGFEWPSIMIHIMDEHNITPDKDFLNSILRDTP